MSKLPKSFYIRNNVITIARELLGKLLVTQINGSITSGIITETEAYKAPEDKASHAYNNKRTSRTEVFFNEGGIAYVYLCYGMHHLFNIITNKENIPHAVLIRSVEPVHGIELMLKRRNLTEPHTKLTTGPGSVSKALGITKDHNAIDLCGDTIWIEEYSSKPVKVISRPRIGVDYAQEYALKPWRFIIAGNAWVSKG
ncbi:MAG: DNA-3-methyladenine glycosylase [Cytophagaceae bacterium]|nr:DNA-3-methyladenine glycosylase [Cytophagaceae bacterium]MDW8456843.1 DNA-3-methyladenine glycosylase [Cytophagaceae bacterium]